MRKQILLVDDSATVEQLVRLAFADESIDVHCAPTLDSARAFLDQSTTDLILVDKVLPDGSAEAFVHSLRQDQKTAAIPAILLASGSRSEGDEIPGIDAVLRKPFESMALLVSTAKDLLRKTRIVEMRPLAELSNQAFHEEGRNDMILEIEDLVEMRSFDAQASAREMMAALSPEVLEQLADKVAAILARRLEIETESRRPVTPPNVPEYREDLAPDDAAEGNVDIDEVSKNPDD